MKTTRRLAACNTLNTFTTLGCWAGNGLDGSGWTAASSCFKEARRQQLLEGLSMLSMLVVAVAGEAHGIMKMLRVPGRARSAHAYGMDSTCMEAL